MSGHLSRGHAAELLRAARQAASSGRGEAAEWAFAAMPERLPAARLYLQALLDGGDLGAAATLLARLRLRHPDHPSLFLPAAQILVRQGRFPRAAVELERALARRPRHVATLQLQARVARAMGRPRRAARALREALACRPGCRRLATRYVCALIRCGRLIAANRLLATMPDLGPLVRARYLRASGRLAESLAALEEGLNVLDPGRQRDRLLVERLRLLEAMADAPRLRSAAMDVRRCGPAVVHQAELGLLWLGEFEAAARMARRLARRPRWAARALHVLVVARALGGDHRRSRAALRRLRCGTTGVHDGLMAECWRRGLRGQLCRAQVGVRAGSLQTGGVLAGLLRRTVRRFDAELSSAEDTAGAADTARLVRLRSECLAGLGRLAVAGVPTHGPGDPA
jgi:tetratricopeptide (TPR) repeat protein